MSVVDVQHINKSYGNVEALREVTVRVKKGEIFGFIGPDGAGKTTLFRILTSLIKPDEGTARVLGKDTVGDYRSLRPLLGYMPGHFSLYQDLSVQENLDFFASVFGTSVEEHYELIEPIFHQLEPFHKRLAGKLSGGMKQKLALSCALIHRPKLLVLDEPTTGVDAVSRGEFWDMLGNIKKKGITIVVSTPYMDEAERCDRVALIQDGAIMEVNPPSAIIENYEKTVWAVYAPDRYRLLQLLRDRGDIKSAHPFGDSVHITAAGDGLDSDALGRYLEEQGIKEVRVREAAPVIEDVFMNLMQKREVAHAS